MLRKLLLLIGLINASNVIAQNTSDQKVRATPAKATEKQSEPKIDYKQMRSPMPPLKFMIYHDSSVKNKNTQNKEGFLTNKDIDNGANLFVMMFNPTCSHCMDQTEELEKHLSLFKKSKLVLMANQVMVPYMPEFYKLMHVGDYPSIYIGFDSSNFINELFLYQALPQINIYNGERKLIKVFTGGVRIDSLEKYIE